MSHQPRDRELARRKGDGVRADHALEDRTETPGVRPYSTREAQASRDDREIATRSLHALRSARVDGEGSWGSLARVRGVNARPALWGPGSVVLEGGEKRSSPGWGPGCTTAFPPPLFQGKESVAIPTRSRASCPRSFSTGRPVRPAARPSPAQGATASRSCERKRSLRRSSSLAWILDTRDSERFVSCPISRIERSSQYLR